MKALILGLLAIIFTNLFLRKPFVKAVGGRAKIWVCLLFELSMGIAVYILAL